MLFKMSVSALPVTFTRGLLCCAWLGLGALMGTSCRPPFAACTDDAREDDDTREQALANPPLSHVFGHGPLTLDGQVACPGDTDWLYAYADCCHPAGVRVRWEAARGALEVDLLDAEGVPLPVPGTSSGDGLGDAERRGGGEGARQLELRDWHWRRRGRTDAHGRVDQASDIVARVWR
ncbi:hypothetical protein [Archangium violaceum]|uniref:Lipoprotein n=1 Tax=Archangium violaceum Cb vi76 TaxID=1406225 RepID=A0A084SPM0_9BACT|nr:hypothetical protein [Archangium violaceum]KFA90405.1 hypothetical protein Q664_28590 [Archangium violaceum Cb vi76]